MEGGGVTSNSEVAGSPSGRDTVVSQCKFIIVCDKL